jgi:hypothetical protein
MINHFKKEKIMRELSFNEVEEVSGGLTKNQSAVATLGLMAICTTPAVVFVGAFALIYYAWC